LDEQKNLNISFPARKGDLMVFKSYSLSHGINAFTGRRKLLIFSNAQSTYKRAMQELGMIQNFSIELEERRKLERKEKKNK